MKENNNSKDSGPAKGDGPAEVGPAQEGAGLASSLYPSSSASDRSQQDSSAPLALDMPRMGAEVGFQVVSEDDVPPFRASGLICLILGLLSAAAMVAWQMLILPIAAIIFGVFALRKWHGRRPAGTTAAVIGLVLASCFGAAGLALPLAKRATLAKQGQYFARQYLELLGNGDIELANELRKEARNRQVKGMNLIEAYKKEQLAKSEMEREENQMPEQDAIQLAGPGIEWELAQSPRVYLHYGIQRVETVWTDPSGTIEENVVVDMQWSPDEKRGIGNWHVHRSNFYREVVYAPSVL